MKKRIKYLVYPFAVVAMSMFIIVGCSDDEDEVLPDPDNDTSGIVTDIDGNQYKTVIIGDQEWMAENLRVSKYNNGDAITTGLSDTEWENTTGGAYAVHPYGSIDGLNSDKDVLEAYGALYNWYALSTGNLCPSGWHIPSNDEWEQLIDYVVSEGYSNSLSDAIASNALKSCRQVDHPDGGDCDTSEHPRWNSNTIQYGFDEFGFSALPGGSRRTEGFYYGIGENGEWWSSSEVSSGYAYSWIIYSNSGRVSGVTYDKRIGQSVRCVRNIEQ